MVRMWKWPKKHPFTLATVRALPRPSCSTGSHAATSLVRSTVTALRDVDLEIDAGEFVVVLGPSGSGKTTLLNIIGALDAASSGQVTIAGRDITGADRSELFRVRREIVSFIFQSFNLFPTLTALENVQCGVEITHKAKRCPSSGHRRAGTGRSGGSIAPLSERAVRW